MARSEDQRSFADKATENLDMRAISGLDVIDDAEVRDAAIELTGTIQTAVPNVAAHVAPNPDYRGAIVTVLSDEDDAFAVLAPPFGLRYDRVVGRQQP